MCSIDDAGASEERSADHPEPGERPAGLRGLSFDVPAAGSALVEAARLVAGLDPAALSEDERLGLLDVLESTERMLTAANMATLAAVDDRAAFEQRFGMTPGAFSEQRHGRNRLSWTRQLRIGRRLQQWMPEVFEALSNGGLSVERATVIANALNARNAGLLADAQRALLDLSAAVPRFDEFAAQVRDLAAVADADGPEPDQERSKGRVSRTGDHVAIVMDLYGTDAIAAEQMLEAEVDRLWKAEVDEAGRIPDLVPRSRAELRAAALVELLRRGTATTGTRRRPSVELSLVIDADRVDDLDPMLAAIVAAARNRNLTGDPVGDLTDRALHLGVPPGDDQQDCPCCGDRHELDGADLPRRFAGRTVTVNAPDGTRRVLTQQQWQLLLCESDISQVLLDALGEPMAVRHLDRFADPAMRTALVARDGGCVFPGCDAGPSWCDAHHVIEHRVGGHTVVINLALLCRRHHGIVHRTGWTMTRRRDGTAATGFFTVTTPSGCTMPTQHRARSGAPPGRPAEPAA
jgi:hypothetical protein